MKTNLILVLLKGQVVSKNCSIDVQVTSLDRLLVLSKEKKAIYVSCWKKLFPATFLIHNQMKTVANLLESNNLYEISNNNPKLLNSYASNTR